MSTQQCEAITKAGTRCTRAARPKSKYCWQHKGGKGSPHRSKSRSTSPRKSSPKKSASRKSSPKKSTSRKSSPRKTVTKKYVAKPAPEWAKLSSPSRASKSQSPSRLREEERLAEASRRLPRISENRVVSPQTLRRLSSITSPTGLRSGVPSRSPLRASAEY